MAGFAQRAGRHNGNPEVNAGCLLEDCHPFVRTGDGICLPAGCHEVGSPVVDHGSVPNTGLCATDSTSTPVRLAFGPVLVYRRCSLSASTTPCPETEPPDHRHDAPGGQSVDARIRRPARFHRARCRERMGSCRHAIPAAPSPRARSCQDGHLLLHWPLRALPCFRSPLRRTACPACRS